MANDHRHTRPSAPQPQSFDTSKPLVVHERLVADYGDPAWSSHGAPLDTLVRTILSQHTSDVNSFRAFACLRERFPDWKDVVATPVAEVAAVIRVGGLANVKAVRIQACLAAIEASRGEYSLDFLEHLDNPNARSFLESLPGVGSKTAACVLLFSLGRPAIPVDTHVHRVSRRLGLVPPRASTEATESELIARLPDTACYPFHVNIVTHGRQICRAKRPLCETCRLATICDYYVTDTSEKGALLPEAR